MEYAQGLTAAIVERVSEVVVGKQRQTELVLVALFAGGHVLIDDVPGTAKTLLVRTLARILGLRFSRVQCTPDLLPADVTGSVVFDESTSAFEFRPGPLFANLVLADEINRASPRTQSAFLEAMQERQVTADGVSYPLPDPFVVLATQNPVESRGTFPLPEAQLDRFLLRLSMGYPSEDEEVAILERYRGADPLASLAPLDGQIALDRVRASLRAVFVSPDVQRYVTGLVRATREAADVELGASPRAAVQLMHAAQAGALLAGRDYVTPDDVAALAPAVLSHRLVVRRDAVIEERSAGEVIERLLRELPVPAEESAAR